jgi:hypothetical protein
MLRETHIVGIDSDLDHSVRLSCKGYANHDI